MNWDLCFIDSETTGLHPEIHEIWEFAGIRRTYKDPDHPKLGFNERRLEFQVKVDLSLADPFALQIGKYWDRFGKKGDWEASDVWTGPGVGGKILDAFDTNPAGQVVTQREAAELIFRFTAGTVLVGNTVSFDSERCERLLRACGLLPRWHYHVQDIEPHIVGYARAKGVNFALPYSSTELTEWLGVEEPSEEERHTAMGDAEWVMRQWDVLHSPL